MVEPVTPFSYVQYVDAGYITRVGGLGVDVSLRRLGPTRMSQRPFGMVVPLARGARQELMWVFVAFGARHPRPGARTVYERAHRRLHGRFPPRP